MKSRNFLKSLITITATAMIITSMVVPTFAKGGQKTPKSTQSQGIATQGSGESSDSEQPNDKQGKSNKVGKGNKGYKDKKGNKDKKAEKGVSEDVYKAVTTLVANGTIDESKMATIFEYFKNYKHAKGEKPEQGEDPLSKLVSDSIITQEQADAIAELLSKKQPPKFRELLLKMVDEGVIEQDVADKINEYLKNQNK